MNKKILPFMIASLFSITSCTSKNPSRQEYVNTLTSNDFIYEIEWVDFSFKRIEFLKEKNPEILHYEVDGYALIDLSGSPFSGFSIFANFYSKKYLEKLDEVIIQNETSMFYKEGSLLINKYNPNNETNKTHIGSLTNGPLQISSSINKEVFKDYNLHNDNFVVYDDNPLDRLLVFKNDNSEIHYGICGVDKSYRYEETIFEKNEIVSRTFCKVKIDNEMSKNVNLNKVDFSKVKYDEEYRLNEFNFAFDDMKSLFY